jgi:hypothetical protein
VAGRQASYYVGRTINEVRRYSNTFREQTGFQFVSKIVNGPTGRKVDQYLEQYAMDYARRSGARMANVYRGLQSAKANEALAAAQKFYGSGLPKELAKIRQGIRSYVK